MIPKTLKSRPPLQPENDSSLLISQIHIGEFWFKFD
jgi:hypothetical protein